MVGELNRVNEYGTRTVQAPPASLRFAEISTIRLPQAQRQISYGFMETGLRLLMRDGAVNVTFRPGLPADQYAKFMTVLDQASTKGELEIAGQKFADERGLEFIYDDLSI
jgi:hypothetical protein